VNSRLLARMVSDACSASEATFLGSRFYGHLEFPTDFCLAAAGIQCLMSIVQILKKWRGFQKGIGSINASISALAEITGQ
jgi:hypothetical protein